MKHANTNTNATPAPVRSFSYFKELTKDRESKLKVFDRLTPSEYDELTAKACAEFNAQKVTAKHGAKTFTSSAAFISSADALHGFYICGAELVNAATNYKLLLIAFETVRGYDFQKHEPKPETLRPVAIYQDDRENLYTIHTATLGTRPLDKWKKELENKAETAKARADLWRGVQRLYKKNGEPFALVSKNFDGVRVIEAGDGFNLETSGRAANGAYISDKLYNCDLYPLKNIDDVMPTIKKYIDYLTEYANETESTLKKADAIYNDVFGALLEKILKYQTPSNSDGLRLDYFLYTVRELVNDFYISL